MGHTNLEGPSPIASPKSPPTFFDGSETLAHSTLQVPKSPRTPRSMGHLIKHRFTKTFKPGKCDYCSDYMFNGKILGHFFFSGYLLILMKALGSNKKFLFLFLGLIWSGKAYYLLLGNFFLVFTSKIGF